MSLFRVIYGWCLKVPLLPWKEKSSFMRNQTHSGTELQVSHFIDKFSKHLVIKQTGFTPGEGAVITGFGIIVLGADYKYSEIASWIDLLGVFGKKLFLAPAQG